MKVVRSADEVEAAIESAQREAKAYFGRDEVYIERYLTWPRHIEMQIVGDQHGEVVWISERDCSAQRRHQKLVEESPAPAFPEETRHAMGSRGREGGQGRRVPQRGHGRVHLPGRRVLLPGDEHPAPGRAPGDGDGHRDRSGRMADTGGLRGAAADDARRRFWRSGGAMPSRSGSTPRTRPAAASCPAPERITRLVPAEGFGLRFDGGYECGDTISQYYDNLIGKLIVWGRDRPVAIARAIRALEEMVVEGVATTIPADLAILRHPDFQEATHSTKWVEERLDLSGVEAPRAPEPPADGEGPMVRRSTTVEVDGKRFSVTLWVPEAPATVAAGPAAGAAGAHVPPGRQEPPRGDGQRRGHRADAGDHREGAGRGGRHGGGRPSRWSCWKP